MYLDKNIKLLLITLLLFSSCINEKKYSLQIKKNLYLKAPDHEAVYVFNYPSAEGIILRASGDNQNQTFPTYKYIAFSNDNCNSFSDPRILVYEDGNPLWSPSSYCAIILSVVNKSYYLITNILDNPTFSSYPRDPLCMAEIIPEKGILLKKTVQIIDTNKEPEVERRRYTNFGMYEDLISKEIILTLPEQPKVSWSDMTADCYEYRIKIYPEAKK